jgi:hypothetical protein
VKPAAGLLAARSQAEAKKWRTMTKGMVWLSSRYCYCHLNSAAERQATCMLWDRMSASRLDWLANVCCLVIFASILSAVALTQLGLFGFVSSSLLYHLQVNLRNIKH